MRHKTPHMGIKHGSMFSFCAGRCGLTFDECMRRRRVDMAQDGKKMAEQEARNLTALFRVGHWQRIRPPAGYEFHLIGSFEKRP